MKIDKNLIQRVANGETSLTGETVKVAREIVENGLQSKFNRYAFFYQGNGNNIYDVQDCILDFSWNGAEISVFYLGSEKSRMKISGMTIGVSLKRLFEILSGNKKLLDRLDGKTMKVNGLKGKFKLCYTALHFCFAEGRISEEECMSMMRV